MRRLRVDCTVAAVVLLVAWMVPIVAHAQNRNPDSTLFTYYETNTTTELNWLTCGSLPQSSGCYGSGQLGPFTNACSVVQSVPAAINSFTVLRYIYVLDSGSGANGAKLFAYKRTDTVNQSNDTIVVTQVASVPLTSLVGGSGVTCMTAQNPTNVYAATNQSTEAVSINKTTYAVNLVGDFSGNVTAITADSYGYVTINQSQSGANGNTVYGPNGEPEQDGGGAYFMINPIDGVVPANYPFTFGLLPRVEHWPKNAQ